MAITGVYTDWVLGSARGVAVSGSYAYVARHGDSGHMSILSSEVAPRDAHVFAYGLETERVKRHFFDDILKTSSHDAWYLVVSAHAFAS